MMSMASDSMPTSGSPARYLRHAPKNISRTCSRDGSNILRLALELAQVADEALRAAGFAREAHIAAMQDQPVMRVLQELRRRRLEKLLFHFNDILSGREPCAVRDAEDVRVDGHGGLAEGRVEDDVGRLAPDAGQALQR